MTKYAYLSEIKENNFDPLLMFYFIIKTKEVQKKIFLPYTEKFLLKHESRTISTTINFWVFGH